MSYDMGVAQSYGPVIHRDIKLNNILFTMITLLPRFLILNLKGNTELFQVPNYNQFFHVLALSMVPTAIANDNPRTPSEHPPMANCLAMSWQWVEVCCSWVPSSN
jgi:serine/threonine protein kinase